MSQSSVTPWLTQNGHPIGSNFGDYGNSNSGVLALTLYYEDTHGSRPEYQDIAQVLINREHLNPITAQKLGIPSGSLQYVIQHSSTVWSGSNLRAQTNLATLLDESIVGQANGVAAYACNQLLQAAMVADDALRTLLNNPSASYSDWGISTQTLWWFKPGSDPVNHNYWNAVVFEPSPSYPFFFENLIGYKTAPPPKSPSPPPPGSAPGVQAKSTMTVCGHMLPCILLVAMFLTQQNRFASSLASLEERRISRELLAEAQGFYGKDWDKIYVTDFRTAEHDLIFLFIRDNSYQLLGCSFNSSRSPMCWFHMFGQSPPRKLRAEVLRRPYLLFKRK